MSWLPKKCIVVPVDFSDASFAAVEVARQLVEDISNLHVLNVTQPLQVAEPGMLWGTITDTSRVDMSGKALREQLNDKNFSGVIVHTVLGMPAREIANLAEKLEADLIVMPSHGRHGLERLFLGSVTERVLRLAKCPVLVLRVPDDDA